MTKKKNNCNSLSSTEQFYHACEDRIRDTDAFSSREDDVRFRPLLIEHLKKLISQGKFNVSRKEVLNTIKKAAKEIKENLDTDINKKD